MINVIILYYIFIIFYFPLVQVFINLLIDLLNIEANYKNTYNSNKKKKYYNYII